MSTDLSRHFVTGHPRHWPRNSLFGTVFDPLHVILPPLGSTSHNGVASRLGPLLSIVLHCLDDLISFAMLFSICLYACRNRRDELVAGAFPCRATFAAVGLGNSRIHLRSASNPQQPKALPSRSAASESALENSEQECRGSMPLEPMPMLLDKEAARQAALNAECIRLMRLDNPGMPQFDTLNKDLLKAWCKHNNIRGFSSKSKNELRDMCLLKLRKKVEAPRLM
ncbi:hypothetical protein QJQ45_019296 [Haematococcus lacustris]|nr:hypothetical protein QJQ45_019296 [Haematococcus lacustris]